jgi:type IV pilus assembly protein PilV
MSMKTRGESGLGLIEVLVALVVVSTGILGARAMMNHAQAAQQNAAWRAWALISIQELGQAMRSNPEAFDQAQSYTSPRSPASTTHTPHACDSQACAASDRAAHDVLRWQQRLAERLPNAHSAIRATGPLEREVWVMWQSPRPEAVLACAPPAPEDAQCLSMALRP